MAKIEIVVTTTDKGFRMHHKLEENPGSEKETQQALTAAERERY